MPLPSVSVVVPTYNRAHCLGEAIDSVLGQSFQDFELIVVDDGSTDGTESLLEGYGDRIKALRQKNSGVSAARNAGIKAARGPWIAFLDSDDTWEPDKLKVQTDDLRLRPDAIVHMVNCMIIDSEGQSLRQFELRGVSDDFSRKPFRERPLMDVLTADFFPSSCMARRDILEKAGCFDTTLSIHEDRDLLTRVALLGPFLVNCHCAVKMRRLEGIAQPLSDLHYTARVKSFQNLAHIYRSLKNDPRLSAYEREVVRRALGGVLCQAAEEHKKLGQWGAFMAALSESVTAEPGPRSLVRALLTATGLREYSRNLLSAEKKETDFWRK
jgi:glycosyltransferase involved in cell wall biosynthesis